MPATRSTALRSKPPAGEQQRLGAGERAVALVHGAGDDQVDVAPLVLEQQEHRALGGAGPLAGDHQAGDRHRAALGQPGELGRRWRASAR